MIQWDITSNHSKTFWNDNQSNGPRSALRLILIYSEETATIIMQGAFVMSLLHVKLLNFTAAFRPYLIAGSHALERYLLFGNVDVLDFIKSADQSGN